MRKALFLIGLCLSSGFTFAADMTPKPDKCPDLALMQQAKFVGRIANPKSLMAYEAGYVGAYQIGNYDSKSLWEVDVADLEVYLSNYYKSFDAYEALKKSHEVLNAARNAPVMTYYVERNQWQCTYPTGQQGHLIIALTPIATLDETPPATTTGTTPAA